MFQFSPLFASWKINISLSYVKYNYKCSLFIYYFTGRKSPNFHDDHSDIENEKFLDEPTSPTDRLHPDVSPNSYHQEPGSEEPNERLSEPNLKEPKKLHESPEEHSTVDTIHTENSNHPESIVQTTTITSHTSESSGEPSVVETTTITTTKNSKKSKKPKPKKRTEPKALVKDFLSEEISNSSKQIVDTHPEDGTGWEKFHKTEGNGNVAWEFEAGEEGLNGNDDNFHQSETQNELWRSPSLEAEMIIKEDVTHGELCRIVG